MYGGPRWSCAEMQDVGELVLVKFFHNWPEPLNNLVILRIRLLVYCMNSPVIQINKRDSVENHFDLVRLKDFQESRRYNFW